MLFRGTKTFPTAHLLATAFEELGGTLDASTAADHGTLGIDVPCESLEAVLPLIATVYAEPLLKEIEIERGVIREEILEDLGEDGELIDAATLVRRLAFPGSGLGRPITGPLSNIEGFSEAQLRAHHARTYIGSDAVISVAGPVDPDKISRSLERAFSSLAPGTPPKAAAPAEQSEARFEFVPHPGNSQTTLSLSFRCPGHQHRLEPALEMLLRVLDDGMATRLYHELCDKRGLCYSASGTFEPYEETGIVELEADAAHERAPVVLEQMLNITDSLKSDLITDAELSRTRKRARWQHQAYMDEPGATADFFALAEITKTAATPAARLEQLLAVTKEDIQAAAQLVFSTARRNVVAVGGADKERLQQLVF
jgi:predicted Zn-dependent peptidase